MISQKKKNFSASTRLYCNVYLIIEMSHHSETAATTIINKDLYPY